MDIKAWMTPKNIKISLITLAVFVITSFFGFAWHGQISTSKEKLNILGAVLRDNVIAQADALGQLTEMAVAAIPQSQPTLKAMDAVLQQALKANEVEKPWEDPQTMAAFCLAESQVARALNALQNYLKGFPQIAQSQQYQTYQEQIQATAAQIAFAKGAMAQEVTFYNDTLTDIPGSWFNAVIFHYKPISVCPVPANER